MIILSDLSEVLIRGTIGTEEYIKKDYGLAAAMQSRRRKLEVRQEFEALLRGHMTEDDFWGVYFSEGKWEFGPYYAENTLSRNLKHSIPGTLDVYLRIRSHPVALNRRNKRVSGIPETHIISDHIANRLEEVKYYHPEVFELISREFWSCELGRIKSDHGFFQDLLRYNAFDPKELVFVDDNPVNVAAAANAGIRSIRFRDAAQLEVALTRCGFEFAPKSES